MNTRSRTAMLMRESRWLPLAIIALILLTFAGTIYVISRHFQEGIQNQIIAREGEVLHSVAVMQYLAETEADPAYSLSEPASQMDLLLKISRLKGVMGARLFNPAGRLITAFPEYVADAELRAADLRQLKQLKPVSRFHPRAELATWFLSVSRKSRGTAPTVPLLEVIVPVHELNQNRLLGAAQFLIDGKGIAAELGALDQILLLQPAVLLFVGGVIIVGGLGWAFHRLRQQAASLLKANLELALAAKTSAVGAITTHLIHGLKGPLFGIQSIVSGRQAADTVADPALQTALNATRQMQAMINQVVDLLRDDEGLVQDEISLRELTELVADKMGPLARAAGVEFTVNADVEGTAPARVANLVLLILANLIHNAIEATPPGKAVRLGIRREKDQVRCEVADEGAGMPAELAGNLFTPCQSRKPGGGGIGLAISKQLANHLDAQLLLQSTSPQGTVFVLDLPVKLFRNQTLLAV